MIEEKDGLTILHLHGSYYEMGSQHGRLLKKEILENIQTFSYFYEEFGCTYEKIRDVWDTQAQYLPDAYKQEIKGMADAMNVSVEQIAIHNTWISVFNHLHSCWGAAMWGDATSSGDILHMRSVDGINFIGDPETENYVYENQVLIIRDPNDAYSSISPSFAGDIICIGGFNENGVAISELTVIGEDTTFHGINAGYRMRMVLDFATNIYEAVEIMNSNKTCCWNFIVSDANNSVGYAIEQSAHSSHVSSWFDPVESTQPFWQIRHVVRRGNCYIDPDLAKIERNCYNPSGIMGFIRMITGKDSTFSTWIQYKAISDEIEKQYGSLTTKSALTLLQDVYLGNTNIFFKLTLSNSTGTGRQWVGSPKSGDMAICFTHHGEEAYQNTIYTFNFYDLLTENNT